jgi:hypothetical protein
MEVRAVAVVRLCAWVAFVCVLAGCTGGSPSRESGAKEELTSPVDAARSTGQGSVPDGWRVESWRGVQVAVPAGWPHVSDDEWCWGLDRRRSYAVGRPHWLSNLMRECRGSRYGYGVYLGRSLTREAGHFPEDAVVLGRDGVVVAVRRPALARRILATVQVIHAVDHNGCRPTERVPHLGDASPSLVPLSQATAAAVSLCRYVGGPHPNLIWSERLIGRQAGAVLTALRRPAERRARLGVGRGCGFSLDNQAVLVRVGTATEVWVHETSCHGVGQDDGHRVRGVNGPLMRWVRDPAWESGAALVESPRGLRLR